MASQSLVRISFCYSTRVADGARICKCNWLQTTRAGQPEAPTLSHKNLFHFGQSCRDGKTSLFLKPGRLTVWAEKSAANNFSSVETDDLVESNAEPSKENTNSSDQHRLLRLLLVAVAVAATVTMFSIWQINWQKLGEQASEILVRKAEVDAGVHFSFNVFGTNIRLGEGAPGWIYFWLLMAAGFGLFVSEEALNVWVGATLARTLTLNGLWEDFISSASLNAPYIFSTICWVYWGVCISDMVPFYAGKFAATTNAGDKLCEKVGVSKEKLKGITEAVQRYGNLIGFVERFSLGVRNPTSFLAGAMGVSPEKYFTGVCLGALITLPLQMGIGFALRERPMAALAGVAAAVGLWTLFPYAAAGLASIIYIIRSKFNKQHDSSSQVENLTDQ